jgi:hypothetical protein
MLKNTTASVKVMRSHDYCHFEVALGMAADGGEEITPEHVDDLRKEAARLADKAVAQYKIAKRVQAKRDSERADHDYDVKRAKAIEEIPEHERTPQQQAVLKQFKDEQWEAKRDYDYDNDWPDNDYDE